MKIILFTILSLLVVSSTFSQSVSITTIIEDRNDSIIGQVQDFHFTIDGNYYYLKETEKQAYFSSSNKLIKLPKRKGGISGSYGNDGEIDVYYTSVDSFYYKNINAITYYKNGYGKIIKHITDFTNNSVALTTEINDSIFYFLNGMLITTNHKDSLWGESIYKWCSFSANGNAIYSYKKDNSYYLKINSNIIDSSDKEFIKLKINDNGDYFYGTGKKGIVDTKFDYMFFPNQNETKYDSVRTIWNSSIYENGGFYCSGANPWYLLINGKYFEHLIPNDIILPNSTNFFFVDDTKRNITYHTVNGSQNLGRKNIIKPSMDKEGNFSTFLKVKSKYQILINGIIQDFNIIGKPISIDSKGNYISYTLKKETVNIYRNNDSIIHGFGEFSIYTIGQFFEIFLRNYKIEKKPKFSNSFDYFEIENNGYIVWNGIISEPIKKVSAKNFGYEYPKIGELLAGDVNENGYYLIQYDGKKKTKLILNNNIFDLGNKIDTIFENSIYFELNKIVFYAICKNKVKRFEIKI